MISYRKVVYCLEPATAEQHDTTWGRSPRMQYFNFKREIGYESLSVLLLED
jgi:hypothetical protein